MECQANFGSLRRRNFNFTFSFSSATLFCGKIFKQARISFLSCCTTPLHTTSTPPLAFLSLRPSVRPSVRPSLPLHPTFFSFVILFRKIKNSIPRNHIDMITSRERKRLFLMIIVLESWSLGSLKGLLGGGRGGKGRLLFMGQRQEKEGIWS